MPTTKRMIDLTATTTPDDTATLWVYDDIEVVKDRKWSLTNLIAWIKSNLGTAAVAAQADLLARANHTGTQTLATISDSGTAAAADLTTSATDATAGRAMRIDDYPGDAEWESTTTLENDWTGTVRYIKRAGTVTVMWDVTGAAKTTDTFLTLAAAYHPAVELKQGATDGHIVIGTAGTLVSESTGATIGMVTYPVMV